MATILLTGAGGAAIPDLIRHLKSLSHRVLTCDMDPHAPGLYLGDGGFVVPAATTMRYVLAMMDLCHSQKIDVAIPLVDEELLALRDFRGAGGSSTPFLAPSVEFVKICLDKWKLVQTLNKEGINCPESCIFDGRHSVPYPAIIKPRKGRGSRGVFRVKHHDDTIGLIVNGCLGWSKDLIAQVYIEGPEYTVSVVCDPQNTVHAVVPKRIILKQSSTRLAVTERNEAIDAVCRKIAETLNPCGPFNVQLRMRDGIPYVFEINPRFSGTVNLTIAAGCDEVGGLIELALGRPYTFGEWKEGVVLVRNTRDQMMDAVEFDSRAPRRWDE